MPAPATHDDAVISLLEVVRRAMDPSAPPDGALAARAADLGFFAIARELSVPGPELAFYASALCGIARHHGALAHLVAAHHGARESAPELADVAVPCAVAIEERGLAIHRGAASGLLLAPAPPSALHAVLVRRGDGWVVVRMTGPAAHDEGPARGTGAWRIRLDGAEAVFHAAPLRRKAPIKDLVDTVAIAAGRLAAAGALAAAFVEERVLFRRRLSEVPAVREALARYAAVAARLAAAATALAHGDRGAGSWPALVADALAAAAGLAQLMGGTGLMEDSRMPAALRDVVALSCRRAGKPRETRLAERLLDQPAAACVTLDS